jgi:hypothetical protein
MSIADPLLLANGALDARGVRDALALGCDVSIGTLFACQVQTPAGWRYRVAVAQGFGDRLLLQTADPDEAAFLLASCWDNALDKGVTPARPDLVGPASTWSVS